MSERHSDLRVLRWTDRITDVLEGFNRGPIRANVDLTNLCSHNCYFCEPMDFRKATIADKRHTLDDVVVGQVIGDLAQMHCQAIQFSGGGEPTLHPHFGDLLELAHCVGMRTLVVTHGGYIPKWQDSLLIAADHVRVSLDASCEDEHLQMHGKNEFVWTVAAIADLVRARGTAKTPEVGITYIVVPCNSLSGAITRFLNLARSCGVDFVQFRPISDPNENNVDLNALAWERAQIEIHETSGWPFRIEILGQRQKDVFFQREFDKCYAALTLATISANGDVSACCDQRGIVFGNVNTRPFHDIWLSPEHRKIASKIVPKFCERCVLCGYNRAVERYVVNNEAVPELI